ncbi:hypothetical protein [Achromobacter anxifer]
MPDTFLADIPLGALATKMFATAFVVIAVSWAVGVFGPVIGGALAGLPVILGPGFYFLGAQAPSAYLAQAASYALLSLSATQCFLLSYIATAERKPPWFCLACAMGAWLCAAALIRLLPAQPMAGVLLFGSATVICLRAGRRFVMPVTMSRGRAGLGVLAARGVLAGALVAIVTSAGLQLGSTGAGLLLAFPIGYTVVAVTVHQKHGSAAVIAMLYAAFLGTISLAGFCVALAKAAPYWTANAALGGALATSVLITLVLILLRNTRAIRA